MQSIDKNDDKIREFKLNKQREHPSDPLTRTPKSEARKLTNETIDANIGKKYPCENAFMTNPIASSNDCTGFTVVIPDDASEADGYNDIYHVPVTSSERDKNSPKSKIKK